VVDALQALFDMTRCNAAYSTISHLLHTYSMLQKDAMFQHELCCDDSATIPEAKAPGGRPAYAQ
jgi:hypothetical protein